MSRDWTAVGRIANRMSAVSGAPRGQHPGVLLQEWLTDNGESQAGFARRVGMAGPNCNNLCKGTRDVGVVSALRLEEGTGIKAETWLSLQADHDIARVRALINPLRHHIVVWVEDFGNPALSAHDRQWYWEIDGLSEHLSGWCDSKFDAVAQAQQDVMELQGWEFWQFDLTLRFQPGDEEQEVIAGDRGAKRSKLLRDAARWSEGK